MENSVTIDYELGPPASGGSPRSAAPAAAPMHREPGSRPPAQPAKPTPGKVSGRRVLDAITDIGDEMAARDDELRDVLGQLGRLYRKLHGELTDRRKPLGTESLELQLQVLVRSVDNLTAVDTVASERVANLSTAIDRLAETIGGLAARIGNLERRAEAVEAEAGMEDDIEDDTGEGIDEAIVVS